MHEATVRIYVTSVFEDSVNERAMLRDVVFPKIEEFCAVRGIQLYTVDFRSLLERRAIPDVIGAVAELDRAAIVLGILGGKSGKILNEVALESDTISELENGPEYQWMNVDGKGCGTNSLMEHEIRRSLATSDPGVVGRPISDPISLFYLRDNRSIIPKDAEKIYQDPHTAASAKTPVRCIGAMCDGTYRKVAGQTVFDIDYKRQTALQQLRSRVKLSSQKGENGVLVARSYRPRFEPPPSGEGIRTILPTSSGLLKGLETFCKHVEHDLKRAILKIYPNAHPQVWPLTTMCDIIRASEQSLLESACRRGGNLHRTTEKVVSDYLRGTQDSTKYKEMGMLIVSGRVGIGKTTICAQAAKSLSDNQIHQDGAARGNNGSNHMSEPFVYHFIGSCPESNELKYMLARLTEDLRRVASELTKRAAPGMIPPVAKLNTFDAMPHVSKEFANHEAAILTFHEALRLACEAARVVDTHICMLVDNLDGLSASGGESMKCTWLPDWRVSVIGQDEDHWLHHLKIVVSIKADRTSGVAERLGKRCHGPGRVLVSHIVPGLNKKQKIELVDAYVSKHPKSSESFTTKIRTMLCNKMSSDLPMYLKLILDEVLENPLLEISKLPHTVPRLMERNIMRTEDVVGRTMAQRVFSALASSNGGLYEFELCRMLNLPPEAVVPALMCMKPFLRDSQPPQVYRSVLSVRMTEKEIKAAAEAALVVGDTETETAKNLMYPRMRELRDERICFSLSDMLDAVQERYFFWKNRSGQTHGAESPQSTSDASAHGESQQHTKQSWKSMHRSMAGFFRSMCFNAKAKRKKADKAIADAMAQTQGDGGDLGTALAADAEASKGMPWRHQTKAHIRGLSCVGYHLRHGDEKILLGHTLTDLTFVSACCGASLIYELLENLKEARRVLLWGRAAQRGWSGLRSALLTAIGKAKKKDAAVNADHIQKIREFIHFLENRGTWLSMYPHLCNQEASNEPDSLCTATHARHLWTAIVEETDAWAQNAVFFTGAKQVAVESPVKRGGPFGGGNQDGSPGEKGEGSSKNNESAADNKSKSEENNDDRDEDDDEGEDSEQPEDEDEENDNNEEEEQKGKGKQSSGTTTSNEPLWVVCDEPRMEKGYKSWFRWVNKPTAPDPCLKTIRGHTGAITHVTFAPDTEDGYEPNLASSSKDGTTRVWSPMGDSISILRTSKTDGGLGGDGDDDDDEEEIYANVCEFCPEDSTMIAIGTSNGLIQIWDAAAGVLKDSLPITVPGTKERVGGVLCMTWSTSGDRLCIGTVAGYIAIVSFDHTKSKFELVSCWCAHVGSINLIYFGGRSIDTTAYIFSGSAMDNTFRIWNAHSGMEMLRKVGTALGVHSSVTRMLTSIVSRKKTASGGSKSGDSTSVVLLRDSKTGVHLVPIDDQDHVEPMSSLRTVLHDVEPVSIHSANSHSTVSAAISSDVVVQASSSGDIYVFDRRRGKPVGCGVLCGHMTAVHACKFSDNGEVLATGSEDGVVKVWTPTPLNKLDQKFASVIASDARGSGAAIVGVELKHLEFATAISMRLHPASESPAVLVTRANGTVEIHDAIRGQFNATVRFPSGPTRKRAQFSADAKRILTVDDARVLMRSLPPEANPRVARGAVEKQSHQLASINDTINLGVDTVGTWCLGPDSTVMALFGGTPRKHIRRTIDQQMEWIKKYDLSCPRDTVGWLQDNRGCMLGLMFGQPSKITKMKFSKNGRVIGTLGKTGEIILWDTKGAKRLDYRASGFRSEAQKPKMLPILAVLNPLPLTSDNMKDFHFSPDGLFLVSVHGQRNVTLWDLSIVMNHTLPDSELQKNAAKLQVEVDGKRSHHKLPTSLLFPKYNNSKLSRGAVVVYGHEKTVSKVTWSPCGRVFATASHDSTIRVTRAHDCHLCAILGDDISTAKVKEVMFSYDASNIVALSDDNTIRSWNVRSALEPVMGPISMLESILPVNGGIIAWSSVSGDDLLSTDDIPPLQPDCLYQLDATATCFSTMLTIDSVLRCAVGTESGMVYLCDLMQAARHPEPIVSAYYPYSLGEERVEKGLDLTTCCPACGLSFILKKRSVKSVNLSYKKARGSSNNTNVPDEAFSDVLLITSCDRCSTILRLNPFISEHPANLHWSGGVRHALPTELMEDSGDEDETEIGAKFGPILRRRKREGPLEFNIVSFQETKSGEYHSSQHQNHQNKLKIKTRKTKNKGKGQKSTSSRPNTRSTLNEGSAFGDSVFIKDGDSAFDMLNLSTYRPETPPPRMRMSVSKMSLLYKQGSEIIPAPRVLPKVFGVKSMEHLSTTRVLTRFDGKDFFFESVCLDFFFYLFQIFCFVLCLNCITYHSICT